MWNIMWNIEILGFEFYFLFYNFFLYCFFGWIYESCLVSFKKKTWVNRGFLNGPIIPIYGAGATVVYMLIEPFQENAVLVFVSGMLIATVLEYVTSYVMERLFHAQWWDYSNYKYNIKGRICLLASALWGFLSILMTDVLQPFMNNLIGKIPRQAGEIAGVIIGIFFVLDLSVTVFYTLQLDKRLSDLAKIREEFSEYMESTKLYETKEELRSRLEEISFANISENIKEQWDLKVQAFGTKFGNKDELESKVKNYMSRYQSKVELKNIIQKRIVKAFPTMKSTHSEKIVEDIRKKRK